MMTVLNPRIRQSGAGRLLQGWMSIYETVLLLGSLAWASARLLVTFPQPVT